MTNSTSNDGGRPAPLPCPCCGRAASGDCTTTYASPTASGAEWADGTPVIKACFVQCMSCGLRNSGLVGGYQTRNEAVAAWNQRTNGGG